MNKKIILAILFVAVVACVFFFGRSFQKSEVSNENSLSQSAEGFYVSPQHNVSFYYATDTSVTEEGDMIYVGGKEGQSVEVFKKTPSEEFIEAVRLAVIADRDPKDCQVFVALDSKDKSIFRASIEYPIDPKSDLPAWMQGKCGDYQASNGLEYFYYDADFPDRFYFFRIGQYAILSGKAENETWQDTFIILK